MYLTYKFPVKVNLPSFLHKITVIKIFLMESNKSVNQCTVNTKKYRD